MKEVTEYTKNPVEDIVLQVNEENVTDLRAEITGPGMVSNSYLVVFVSILSLMFNLCCSTNAV